MKYLKKFQTFVRNYFGFSQMETNAMYVLIPLSLITLMIVPIYKKQVLSGNFSSLIDSIKMAELRKDWTLVQSLDSNRMDADTVEPKNLTLPERNSKSTQKPEKIYTREKFDINQADTTQLKSIYGIGSVLSGRIIRFRDGLGGFVSFDQLYRVYHLDSSVVEKLRNSSYISNGFEPKKWLLHQASVEELRTHPFIDYKIARLLKNYFTQHPDMTNPFDFTEIPSIDTSFIDQIKPYLSFEKDQ